MPVAKKNLDTLCCCLLLKFTHLLHHPLNLLIVRPALTDTADGPLDMQELPDARGTPDEFMCTVLALLLGLFPLMLNYRDMLPFCPLTFDHNESIYTKTAFLINWGGGVLRGPLPKLHTELA